ncbi:MAG: hypothetical protein D3924_00825 [Candidatus Electrothrix sp. AR4]|nr:hypothetical protein [Candidatus Electrothrix sp. AR4]
MINRFIFSGHAIYAIAGYKLGNKTQVHPESCGELFLDDLVKSQRTANRQRQLKELRDVIFEKLDFLRNHHSLGRKTHCSSSCIS